MVRCTGLLSDTRIPVSGHSATLSFHFRRDNIFRSFLLDTIMINIRCHRSLSLPEFLAHAAGEVIGIKEVPAQVCEQCG
jgi:hypothetical protein